MENELNNTNMPYKLSLLNHTLICELVVRIRHQKKHMLT